MTIQPGSFWRHSKSGNPYVVLVVAKLEATEEAHVVYRRVDLEDVVQARAGASLSVSRVPWSPTWVRPLREWEKEVSWFEVDGGEGTGRWRCAPRFVPLL